MRGGGKAFVHPARGMHAQSRYIGLDVSLYYRVNSFLVLNIPYSKGGCLPV